MNTRLLHTPEGVRDIKNNAYREKKTLTDKLFTHLETNGYSPVETPTFEFFDVFSRDVGTTPSSELYKFDDREGRTLVLRPDFTPSMARVASKLLRETGIVRLCYAGSVFRNLSGMQGRLKESTQLGAEFIGEVSLESDAEIIQLVVELLHEAGLKRFKIGIGYADIFRNLIAETDFSDRETEELRELIFNHNERGVRDFLKKKDVAKNVKEMFALCCQMFDSPEELRAFADLADGFPKIEAAISYLTKLYRALDERGVSGEVDFEPGLLGAYSYYTGILFSGYTFGTGEPVVKGGRYDNLMENFGTPAPAIGFAIELDSLLNALSFTHDGYLTVALGKGRLAKKAMQYFDEIGIPCVEMEDESTRKLIFTNEEKKMRFFLAKGPDVPTYVEYGAADIGIVGADTIYEEERSGYEVLDLDFGKCRMCICGPEDARLLLNSGEPLRVATKYPHIAKDYFFNRKQQTVEIIKLNGSIELAPIVGLADVICDIVETGSTLKENGLVVLEEVKPLSARLIVNTVSYKMEYERVTGLIEKLSRVVG